MAGISAAELLFRAKGDTEDARREFRELKNEASGSMRSIASESNTASTALGSFLGNFAAGVVSQFTSSVISAAKALFDYSARMEQTKIGFATLMGGAGAASKHLKDLQKFAQETPFEFESLTVASRRLQNVGLEAAQVIPVMRDIGNAAAAAGASSTELDSITLAFSQIIAKGKLSAEEVNQLAERGIPVWRMLEQQLGKTKGEIIKLAEQGKISSEVFLKAFREFSQANFGDAMQAQSRTFSGAMSTIKDIVIQTADSAFAPIYKAISSFAVNVSMSLSRQQGEINSAGMSFGRSLGTAMGVGFQQSGFGSEGYFSSYLFGPSALAKIAGGARDFGREIARGAKAGFNEGFAEQGASPSGVPIVYDATTNVVQGGTAPVQPPAAAAPAAVDPNAEKDLLAAQERLNKAQKNSIEQAYAELQAITKKNYEDRLVSAEKFNADFIENERQFTARLIQLTQEEFAARLAAAKNQTERQAIEIEERTAIEKINEDSRKRLDAARDLTVQNEKKAADEKVKIREEAASKEIAIIRAISETELARLREERDLGAITTRQMIERTGLERKSVLESILARTTDATQRKVIQEEINQQLIKNREDLRNFDKEEKERHEEKKKRWAEYIEHLAAVKEREDELERRRAEAAEREREEQEQKQFDQIGGGLLGGIFSELGLTVEQMAAPMNILNGIGQMLGATFQQLASGVGAAVKAFVLFGNSGTSFRKVAAEMIASIAQMALVQALWEMAQWAAMTALFYFTGNPKFALAAGAHLTAAIIYGAIGGIAAVVGRAVAGNSFQSETAGGFGSAGAGTRSGQNQNTDQQGRQYSSHGDEVTIIESGINRAAPASRITLDIRPTDAFIVEVVKDDINNNGVLRTTVQDA